MEILLGRKQAALFLQEKPPKKILDVATGTGVLAYELAKLGHSVIGIDISQESISQAKSKYSTTPNLNFQYANATNLPFNDGEFDVASISFTLHDMPIKTAITVLQEMQRVTKKNGKLLIVDYNEPAKSRIAALMAPLIKSGESSFLEPFLERGLENIVNQIGLETTRSTTYLGIIQILTAKKK